MSWRQLFNKWPKFFFAAYCANFPTVASKKKCTKTIFKVQCSSFLNELSFFCKKAKFSCCETVKHGFLPGKVSLQRKCHSGETHGPLSPLLPFSCHFLCHKNRLNYRHITCQVNKLCSLLQQLQSLGMLLPEYIIHFRKNYLLCGDAVIISGIFQKLLHNILKE